MLQGRLRVCDDGNKQLDSDLNTVGIAVPCLDRPFEEAANEHGVIGAQEIQ